MSVFNIPPPQSDPGSVATALVVVAALVVGLGAGRESAAQRAPVLELARSQFLILRTLGLEADVYAHDVLGHAELVGAHGTLALEGGVEGAQSVQLHAHALAHHLGQTLHHLVHHTLDDALAVRAVVLVDVAGKALQVQRVGHHGCGVPLAVGLRLHVVVLIQVVLHRNLVVCHNLNVFFMVLNYSSDELLRVVPPAFMNG